MGRVTGPDLMREVFAVSGRYGWSHFFYGSDKETLDALRVSLSASYPDMIIAGVEPSKFRPLTDDEMSELVALFEDSGADFVWVGLGAPRQEQFCYDLKGKTSTVMIGVGGAFKVLSGLIPEAPQWVQDFGMEWLFRLLKEPRRLFKRYLVTNTKFLFYHFTHAERRKGDL